MTAVLTIENTLMLVNRIRIMPKTTKLKMECEKGITNATNDKIIFSDDRKMLLNVCAYVRVKRREKKKEKKQQHHETFLICTKIYIFVMRIRCACALNCSFLQVRCQKCEVVRQEIALWLKVINFLNFSHSNFGWNLRKIMLRFAGLPKFVAYFS